ncbi:nitrous oxide reductase accessory protein NosL [Azospirillum halopraeferens]|uniref:nitrous oxide reductase accessory protein NosL n=1 Tax=Azospirillum halopraeferens TaxID=34010 RepID=UPI0003FAFA62|nr:nitrous oxide reductase accessory protein NosL [Azospirillum halopraeferens]
MRMSFAAALLVAPLLLSLTACKEEVAATLPPPLPIAADAVGHYCGMELSEHPGPKGQAILKSGRVVWMSSVRDAFAFSMLPEEPRDYRALYVTDVSGAADPAHPDLTRWIEARQAWYVLGSRLTGGMGLAEPYPFAGEAEARAFAAANGGVVRRFAEVHEDEILTPLLPGEDPFAGGGHDLHTADRSPR